MQETNTYKVVGLMSGTSLDGLDIALCYFERKSHGWDYRIEFAETVDYSDTLVSRLNEAQYLPASDFVKLHIRLGEFHGKAVKDFLYKNNQTADFIASHGQTIYHQPEEKITFQISSGASIAAETGLPVVCDFRSVDVALKGQGAPLVPIGDKLLFHEYFYCLNLGGFANISFDEDGKRLAFDICPVNYVLNFYSRRLNESYDDGGNIASKGFVQEKLLKELDRLEYFSQKSPKSLGREWVEKEVFPLIEQYNLRNEDILRTYIEHIVNQVSKVVDHQNNHKLLITGGGAHNTFLILRMKEVIGNKIVVPVKHIVDFKEALIFAFLGVLRLSREVNCLKSVTGSLSDHIGGAVYRPF